MTAWTRGLPCFYVEPQEKFRFDGASGRSLVRAESLSGSGEPRTPVCFMPRRTSYTAILAAGDRLVSHCSIVDADNFSLPWLAPQRLLSKPGPSSISTGAVTSSLVWRTGLAERQY